jgi:signal transduction histidine kinase
VRRIIYAYLISISDGPSAQYAFLQFTLIITFSILYILYLLQFRPYISGSMNYYVQFMETNFLLICIMSYFFTDASPQFPLKKAAAWIVVILLVLMISIFVGYALYFIIKGGRNLKEVHRKLKEQRKINREDLMRKERDEEEKKRKRREQRLIALGAIPENSTTQGGLFSASAGNRWVDDFHYSTSEDED